MTHLQNFFFRLHYGRAVKGGSSGLQNLRKGAPRSLTSRLRRVNSIVVLLKNPISAEYKEGVDTD